MSDLEKDIATAKNTAEGNNQRNFASLKASQRKAGEIVRKYEKEMTERFREEAIHELRHHLHT